MATYQFLGQDIVAPFRITSNEPSLSADSVSLRFQRVRTGAQRWELEFGVIMQDSSAFFADSISSFHDIITMDMPQLNVGGQVISQGTSSSTITTSGAHAANESSIAITGATGTITKGRFLKFSNHDKLYIVKDNYSGTGDLEIYPTLRKALPAATTVHYKDTDPVTFVGIRDFTNISGIIYTDGVLSEAGNINLIEAI
jgi:hypothetical protein